VLIYRAVYYFLARYVAGTDRAMFRKNKGLASFLTAFVENLGKTCPLGELGSPFARGLATVPITYVFL
jgi:hypothetical protein